MKIRLPLLGALLALSVPAFSQGPAITLEQGEAKARTIVAAAKSASAAPSALPAFGGEKTPSRPNALQSALRKCPDAVRRGFLSSLVFVNGKFAGAEVQGVQECLGDAGYKSVRAMFGEVVAADNKGYRCESQGTCAESMRRICTDNCMSGFSTSAEPAEQGFVSVEKALAGQPPVVRDAILDGLVLKNGKLDLAALRANGKN